MAGHSVWRHLVTQKPDKKQNLRADFKIAEGYSIGHGIDANIHHAVGQGGLF